MAHRASACLLLIAWTSSSLASIGVWEGCGGRLERALDALQRDATRKNRIDEEGPEAGLFYHRALHSAPLDMTVSRMAIKLPFNLRVRGDPWAQVESCTYEPVDSSLHSRLIFNDLSVSGLVTLIPRHYRAPIPAESCRMTLRLRRAGIDFYTSPIARGRGQMRIRTESSFLEPKFASIYAYACRPTRLAKQIKRKDKWLPLNQAVDSQQVVAEIPQQHEDPVVYDAAEPREPVETPEQEQGMPSENRQTRALYTPAANIGIWLEKDWITRSSRRRRSNDVSGTQTNLIDLVTGFKLSSAQAAPSSRVKNQEPESLRRSPRTVEDITPRDFAVALAKKARSLILQADNASLVIAAGSPNVTSRQDQEPSKESNVQQNSHESAEQKASYKRETEKEDVEERDFLIEEDLEDVVLRLENDGHGWQSREGVAREMEDVFLRGASEALTSYIERQLHPAIKETLMLSMGYTISYG